MTIIVSVPDSAEGPLALAAAIDEAKAFGTDLVAVNLGLRPLKADVNGSGVDVTIVDRADRDPVDTVLDEIAKRNPSRLVIGVKRRSPVGKAMLGSVSQRLLLASPIPVLAVKLDED
ncbi:universal stress protein [Gordonia sp. TBRC 11910]|uniref:Universal stress protein n=1 Tax=Gordonia asplenii TaxID=2725283 RepID=A0A848KUR7_9ACTN|nr:universal stress protein [Gordonia asplenii]NMO02426.1 universal stress protein [Gordonia asplenii]